MQLGASTGRAPGVDAQPHTAVVMGERNGRDKAAISENEDDAGSAEEPQKNHRKREGDLRQCDEEVSYHGITILLTTTPEAHDGLD